MDPKIKVVIAEDHIDAQEIIASFIEPLKTFEVIGIVDNGESLLELNFNRKPNLIIADINMPKLNGIEAISSCLKVNPDLKFIYTTAYDDYAVKAFDLNAVDYVMKPIKQDRLYIALERVSALLLNQSQVGKKEILTIKRDSTSYFIHFSKIVCIEKENRKTIIHTEDQKYETNESLDSMFKRLNDHFFRTHRSFIVNVNYISHIVLEGETYFAYFRNYPHYAHVSKRRINELYKTLSYDIENF
ncbi:LytR/AlgR family response regulator transcription factor [Alkalihalobacterium sp. APHAB7]|uniref:LytR/AlgR family response regulator transcription factor n=1 Tax=Alkalihalobacterium sp. APHAB7 TaxID=3402081 RepID=UPI003AADCFCD